MFSLKTIKGTFGPSKMVIIVIQFLITIIVSVNAQTGNLKLLILHNNDMHARFEQTSVLSGVCFKKPCYGGFARVGHVIREERKKANESASNPRVLFLNAGDTYTGTVWFTVHREKIVSEFINLLEPDALSLGNHEFDDGVEGLLPFIEKCNSPVVAANLDFSGEPELQKSKIKKSVTLTLSTGHKIGVIGYLTPETMTISNPGAVIFNDEVKSIRRESEKLQREGVKIIIAVGHSGFVTDKKIAAEVPLVDIVVGGHTNTFLYNGKPPSTEIPESLYPTEIIQSSGKKVPVVQAYAYTKYMGRLSVEFNSDGDLISFSGQPQLLDETVPEDKDILAHLDKYRAGIEALKKKVIGKTRVLLDGTTCRLKECNIGNMVNDAIVEYHMSQYVGKYWTDAPISLLNGGGLRTSIDFQHRRGNITQAELLAVLPFDNPIIRVNITGKDLFNIFEHSVEKYETEQDGSFMQVSGIQVVYNISKRKGNRVVSLKTKCSQCPVPTFIAVDTEKTYTVLVPKFLADGGDGYTMFKNKALPKIVEGVNDVDSVTWYFSKHNPVISPEEGRISFLADTTSRMENNANRVTEKSLHVIVVLVLGCLLNSYLPFLNLKNNLL